MERTVPIVEALTQTQDSAETGDSSGGSGARRTRKRRVQEEGTVGKFGARRYGGTSKKEKKTREAWKIKWNYIKTKILQVPEWKRFDHTPHHTHPLIFHRVLNPETTDKEIEALQFMIFLKTKQNPNEITAQRKKDLS